MSASPPPADRPRFPWRAFFHRSTAPVFVVSGSRNLRYANPAWEKLTGRALAQLRGTRFSAARRSASPLWAALAPPSEVWDGRVACVRRPVPPADAGPPWWDVTFVPLPGPTRPLGVLGLVSVVGEGAPRGEARIVPGALADLRKQHAARFTLDLFAGPSAASERLVAQARLAAKAIVPVWLVGEPGSGKETLARVIHHAGPLAEKAFLGLDCAGLQPGMVTSLLFGKGGLATTGHLGTVYLKDPATLPRDVQDRVASLFADRPGLRLICGSAATAADDVRTRKLLPAFHTALAVLELRLPPLRERPQDLPALADCLLDRFPTRSTLAEDVWPVLRSYRWPGNVRELADVLDSAVRKAGDAAVAAEHLPRFLRERHLIAATPAKPAKAPTLDEVLGAVERRLIENALRNAGNSQTDAAAALGVVRARLARRIEALGIPVKRQEP
jgi:transcriptional regulator of aromatic amino acid metabolism